ncbi:MAG: hypothetical protein RMM53_13605, partial [Bacteroidia bacterium]|nr:hypothetical protein [Bacteroidia bacterium]
MRQFFALTAIWATITAGLRAQSITLDETQLCRSAEGPEVTVTGTVAPPNANLRVKNAAGDDITLALAQQLRLAKNPVTGAFYAILDGPNQFSLDPAVYTFVVGSVSAQVSIYYAGAQIVGPLSFSACDLPTELQLSPGSPGGGDWQGPGVTNGIFDPVAAGPGEHEIVYSGTYNGCDFSTSALITVSEPTPGDYISGVAASYCVGSVVSGTVSRLDGTLTNNNGNVSFDPQTGAFEIPNLAPGDYELVYTVPGGCTEQVNFTVANPN